MTSNNNDFNLNYERIREKVSENIEGATGGKKTKKRGVLQSLKYAASVLLSAAVTLGATLTIQGFLVNNNETNSLIPSLSPSYVEEFDEFVAVGGSEWMSIPAYVIRNSGLISEKAKTELAEYEKNDLLAYNKNRNSISYTYSCYLGVKDGKDKVLIKSYDAPYKVFIFDSALNYPLSGIVKVFEEKYGVNTKISNGYGTDYDVSAIKVNFKVAPWIVQGEEQDNFYFIEFYTLILEETLFVISPQEINI